MRVQIWTAWRWCRLGRAGWGRADLRTGRST